MKCPGCGAEMADGNQYCGRCGGKVSGLTVDYTQGLSRPSDLYEVDMSEEATRAPFDDMDEQFAASMWIRFAFALILLPLMTIVSFAVWMVEGRQDALYYSLIFLGCSAFMFVFAVKYYKGHTGGPPLPERKLDSKFRRRM